MTENKRFVNKGKDIFQYGEWWCSANGEHCADVIATAINELIEENEQLQHKLSQQEMEYATTACRQAEENEELKDRIDNYNTAFKKLQDLTERKINENEQLKQSSTMYYNLFKELQRQMQGVKSIYDLDSKDFEDLIELSKGNVFTDEIGWVHLPIKELQE